MVSLFTGGYAGNDLASVNFRNGTCHYGTVVTNENVGSLKEDGWMLYDKGNSWVEVSFNIQNLNDIIKNDSEETVKLHLEHRSYGQYFDFSNNNKYAPVSILVNGQTVASFYSPGNDIWTQDQLSIGKYLVQGKNTIRIQLLDLAQATYVIGELAVVYDPEVAQDKHQSHSDTILVDMDFMQGKSQVPAQCHYKSIAWNPRLGWSMFLPGSSYIEISFTIDKLSLASVSLYLKHHSPRVYIFPPNSPISITVNGMVIEESFSPKQHEWTIDKWDITDFLVDGENSIQLKFLGGGASVYALSSLKVLTN